jgi:hypothetical protein
MQTAILAASLIQSIIAKNEIVRGRDGAAYGGIGTNGVQFYHVLKYLLPHSALMETVYEGTSAMDAADAYVRMAGSIVAHGDAVRHNIEKNRQAKIRVHHNVQ